MSAEGIVDRRTPEGGTEVSLYIHTNTQTLLVNAYTLLLLTYIVKISRSFRILSENAERVTKECDILRTQLATEWQLVVERERAQAAEREEERWREEREAWEREKERELRERERELVS